MTMRQAWSSMVDSTIVRSSTAMMESLWRDTGCAALAAAAVFPGLLAALDQHSAAVRDALSAGAGVIGISALAGYVKGILEVFTLHGHDGLLSSVAVTADWTRPTWLELRLAAVCVLARQCGYLPA